MPHPDLNKSLQDLEGEDWGEATFTTHLVTECHRLHRLPLCEFKVEDLETMIGQELGLEWLMPLALEHLRKDPFVEGDFYRGDLLANVLRVKRPFWQKHTACRDEVSSIAKRAISSITKLTEELTEVEVQVVTQAYEQFQRQACVIS